MVIKRQFGHLHGAVNCIATPGVGPLLATTDRDWKLVGEAVAYTGVQTKAQVGRMLETGGGNIVNWVARGSYESELDTILAKCIFELTLGFRSDYGPNNIGAVPFYGWMDESDMFEHLIQISSVDPGLAD